MQRGELREIPHPNTQRAIERRRAKGTLPGGQARYTQYQTQDGTVVAHVQYFVDADGNILASGKPDPKWLRSGDEVLIPYGKPHGCPACALRPLPPE